jgi:hypothetical protein
MPEKGQIQKSKAKAPKKKRTAESATAPLSQAKKQKLEALDEYIEEILQEAGEDFLDQFKQIEGQ